MIADIDVFEAAKLLIGQDGEGAHDVAKLRAERLLSRGDHAGYTTWTMIADAVAELQRDRGPDEMVN